MSFRRIGLSLIYAVVIFIALLISFNTSIENRISSDEGFRISVDRFSPSFAKHKISAEEVGQKTYRVRFDREDLSFAEGEPVVLIMNKVVDNAVTARVNGVQILRFGDMEAGRSQGKASYLSGIIDPSLLEDHNTLELTTFTQYKSGSEGLYIYFVKDEEARSILAPLRFYQTTVMQMGLGFIGCSAIFVFLVYITSEKRDPSFLYCSLAAVFFVIYFFDYMPMEYLRMPYLTAKKFYLMSLYIGSSFFVLAISRFVHSKVLNVVTVVMMVTFTIATFLSRDMLTYKIFYDRFFLVFLAAVALALIMSIININRSDYIYLFVISFFGLGLYAGASVILELTGKSFPINSPSVYILIMGMLPLLIGLDYMLYSEEAIKREQLLREGEFIRANTDGLTGVWNQRYLLDYLPGVYGPAAIAMIDLDDFKQINDRYGHLAGDKVLTDITSIIKACIDTGDLCFRYGGDEFVVVSRLKSVHRLENKMQDVVRIVGKSPVYYEKDQIHVSVSIGVYGLEEGENAKDAMSKADHLLYASKQSGKNKVSVG